ncbi:MAG: nucleotidyltransferase family protein [Candidatus Omnitrophica bacterium]|nr:nucleotidyltransferase family protein [Candidatus Omnitrophota bacterium]
MSNEDRNIEEIIFRSLEFDLSSFQRNKLEKLLIRVAQWDKLINLLYFHQIIYLLYYNLSKLQYISYLPAHIINFLKEIYFNNLIRNIMLRDEFIQLNELAKEMGCKIVPFKGLALLESIYTDYGLRSFADIDILVEEKDVFKIKNTLLKRGYEEKGQKNNLLFVKKISKDINCIIELHTAFSPPRPYKVYIGKLWERLESKNLSGKTVFFLSKEDTFLSLIFHLRRHTQNLILKFIYDIAIFLFLYGDDLDWQYIFDLAMRNHIKNTVYFSFYISKEFFNVTIPSEIMNRFKPSYITQKFMYLCLNKNNFFKNNFFRRYFLRILLFDSLGDIFLYFYRIVTEFKKRCV